MAELYPLVKIQGPQEVHTKVLIYSFCHTPFPDYMRSFIIYALALLQYKYYSFIFSHT